MNFDQRFYYDQYPRIEEDFGRLVDRSLDPRGPEQLYDALRQLELPPESEVVDVGCGEGRHTLRLAMLFGCTVLGIDPVQRHLDLARAARRDVDEAFAARVSFERGSATAIPLRDASVDLVWCRDVLVHEADLQGAYAEFARVLRSGGHALVYQMFATDLLEPSEAAWLLPVMGVVESSADPAATDAAIASSGLRVEACVELGSEWGEHGEESDGSAGRALLRAARLRRDPDRYRSAYGDAAYDVLLGESLWHVYRMLGKLSPRIYLLAR